MKPIFKAVITLAVLIAAWVAVVGCHYFLLWKPSLQGKCRGVTMSSPAAERPHLVRFQGEVAAFEKHGVLPHPERFLKKVDAPLNQPREVTRTEMMVKAAIPALLLAVTALTVAQAHQNARAQGTDATAQTLKALEEKWVAALMKSDTATLDSILSDSYVDTDEHGQRTDKQGALSVLKSGDLKFESIKLSDMQVHHYGEAALVIGSAVQAGHFKGQSLMPKIVFTDTFVTQNGKWKAVASHRSGMCVDRIEFGR